MTHRLRHPTAARSVELDADEALHLLGSVALGRIVFSQEALPAIRPVHHILDDGDIVFRNRTGAALTAHAGQASPHGVVVAYQADDIDLDSGLRWSVVVTGYCHLVTDPERVAHYQSVLQPCPDRPEDSVVRIRPDLVTGIRLVPADGTPVP